MGRRFEPYTGHHFKKNKDLNKIFFFDIIKIGGPMKKTYMPIIFLILNILVLSTFGISFQFNLFLTNIISFSLISMLLATTVYIANKYDFDDYVNAITIFNFIAIIYIISKYFIGDYSWSGLVPSIGYFYILLIGFIVSSLYQIYTFFKK